MIRAIFDNAAAWVLTRLEGSDALRLGQDQVGMAQALEVLHALALSCRTPVLFVALMPGSELEVLVLPSDHGAGHLAREQGKGQGLAPAALSAIGKALEVELGRTGTDMAQMTLDDNCEVFAFRPEARAQMLTATALTLLEAEAEVA
jgi:hypothetical protein